MARQAASPEPLSSSGLRQVPPPRSPLLAAAWAGGWVVGLLGVVACFSTVLCVQNRLEALRVELGQLREELRSKGHGSAVSRCPKESQVRARPAGHTKGGTVGGA